MKVIKEEIYQKEKETAQKFYSTIKSVRCPYFGDQDVFFTSEGFNHILYKNPRVARAKADQIMRFRSLETAKKLINISSTCQEKEITNEVVIRKFKKRKEKITKAVQYWGFIAILDKKKIKVIIKKTGEGKIIFWSIIPYWRTTKHGDMVFRDFATGNLEED